MRALLSYLILPKAVTRFEAQYLRRLNRIALIFFYAHVPAMMIVAALAHTNVTRAGLFTAALLVGPTLAYQTMRNVRHLSLVFGFTAMCMGGLLVHFGQGPMQIEMHFYFFVLIALMAVFANPMAILMAAVTVALHHLILYLVLPRSVFNYDASVWAVVVHALFVVLESVAACFVARSFFDNVIGLERIVDARTAALRLLLDNAEQGFVRVDREGTMSAERSAAVDRWLRVGGEQPLLWEALAKIDASAAEWLQLGWGELWADILPLELAIDQLPRRVQGAGTVWALGYRPINDAAGRLDQVLVIIDDVTSQAERERAEAAQRELMQVFQRLTTDRSGFVAFVHDAQELVERLEATPRRPQDEWRDLHTLKGNCGMFGVATMVTACHELEARVMDEQRGLAEGERTDLASAWRAVMARVQPFIGASQSVIEISPREHERALTVIEAGAPQAEVAGLVRSWRHDPTEKRLERLAEAARRVAARLGKGPIDVVVEHNDLRIDAALFGAVWSAMPHLVRNAVDHGLESSEERVAAGKKSAGALTLRTRVDGEHFTIEVEDDGRGVPWVAVSERARALGLPSGSPQELLEALFHDGLSTKEEATEVSGRGVGLAAVRAACRHAGGEVTVHARSGGGTRFELRWPLAKVAGRDASARYAA